MTIRAERRCKVSEAINFTDDRKRLASALKSLRADAGLSTTQLAKVLGWSQSKVSKTELGRSLPRPDDVEAWARVAKADGRLREELVEIARRGATQATEWRRALAPGRRRLQEDIQRLETAASVIRVFSPVVVVGLAQTRPYVEAVFRLEKSEWLTGEPFQDVVQARLNRQSVLSDRSKKFYLLMSEAALRRQLTPMPDMRDQIKRLVGLSELPTVVVEVIPFEAHEQVHQYHGFAILGDPDVDTESLAVAETVTRGLFIRSSEEVKEYITHFEALRTAAFRGDDLRRFLRKLM